MCADSTTSLWRLIDSGFQSGAMNMALDEVLLHAVANGTSPPVLRFYRWAPATVTLGYAQSVSKDVDLDVCREAGLDVVRRSTGGRAVLHDQEVTYAVIAPTDHGVFGNSVLDCYRVISEVLLKALRQLGLPAQLVPGKPRGGHRNATKAVCFSAPSQYELVIDGRKVAGSAQKRHGRGFLQHGSIPVEMDLDLLGRVLKAEANPETAGSLETVGWLNHWCQEPLSVAAVAAAFRDSFARELQIEWVASAPTAAESAQASELVSTKFGNPAWNMKL